jgi:hypothetical protein
MRVVAQRIITSTEDMSGHTNRQWQQVMRSLEGAPDSVRSALLAVLDDISRDLKILLEERQSLGTNLLRGAEQAEQHDQAIAASLAGQPGGQSAP